MELKQKVAEACENRRHEQLIKHMMAVDKAITDLENYWATVPDVEGPDRKAFRILQKEWVEMTNGVEFKNSIVRRLNQMFRYQSLARRYGCSLNTIYTVVTFKNKKVASYD